MKNSELSAVHAKCVDCSGGYRKLAAGCKIDTCPLHPYRPFAHTDLADRAQLPGQMKIDDYIKG